MSNHITDDIQRICDQTIVLILAGGQGTRLYELTESMAKPGLEFGGNYRIIDFPLSNCVNSGLKKIGVMTQYKSRGLIHHLIQGWSKFNQEFGHSFEVLPASQQFSSDWYLGTADALYQNKDFIRESGAKYVMVLAGDHIYKMDYRSMLKQHVKRGAELSVACIEVPVSEAAGQFGVMSVDECDRIISFEEKPLCPATLADKPGYSLASMGNYIFNIDFLIEQLTQDAQISTSDHDFGKNIIPSVLNNFFVQAYRFKDNKSDLVPYWRDVGTIDSYWLANMALLASSDRFDLYDPQWPIWCSQVSMPPAIFTANDTEDRTRVVSDSLISNGCVIEPSRITKSLLFANVSVAEGVSVDECLVLPNAKIAEHSKLRRVIVAHNCHIPANFVAGFNRRDDQARGFRVSPNGVVLITQSMLSKLECTAQTQQTLPQTLTPPYNPSLFASE